MTTQNRYYSNLSQGSFITTTGGLPIGSTSMTVQATVRWPVLTPFAVRVEPGTANEEVVLVTSGSGTAGSPYLLMRGYDGTAQVNHSQGSAVVPGFCQADLAEPQQHINQTSSTSGAHGLPSNAWGGGTMQLIQSLSYTQASAATFNFPTIPQTYNTLRFVYNLQGNGNSAGELGPAATFADAITLQFNNVTSSVYDGLSSYTTNNGSSITTGNGVSTSFWCGAVWNQLFATPGMGSGWIELPGYANNAFAKNCTFSSVATDNRGSIANLWGCGGTRSTSSITSAQVTIIGSSSGYNAGSIQLYGIS